MLFSIFKVRYYNK